ncbi:SH3-domain-containing protein [Suillus ampliporus]|nr:SH3-domain-containing protein [Suillus ampliporus]
MAVPHDTQSAALLAHLESQNYMSTEDARNMREIILQLPGGAGQSVVTTSVTAISPAGMVRTAVMPHRHIPPPPVQAPAISPAAPSQQPRFVKATWAYNEDGSEPNDLSFSAGEVIEVISEKNQDWWLGRARGREALIMPFGAALHGTDRPPAVGAGVNSVGLQEASGQAEKKNKFSGSMMAHSAAGGVGFGAGAAIGGGLVRAIF